MKNINDLPIEAFKAFWIAYENKYCDAEYPFFRKEEAEHFFAAGYEAAIAERAKFDEQNKLIVKDITEL